MVWWRWGGDDWSLGYFESESESEPESSWGKGDVEGGMVVGGEEEGKGKGEEKEKGKANR